MKKSVIAVIVVLVILVVVITSMEKESGSNGNIQVSSGTAVGSQQSVGNTGTNSSNNSTVMSSNNSFSSGQSNHTQNNNGGVVTLNNLVEIRDYLNDGLVNGTTDFEFRYNGSEKWDASELSRITASCCVEWIHNNGVYTISVVPYPGDRMAKAYFSGDYSKLNQEEKETLNQAIDMVNQAKSRSNNNWELELNIHDMLVDLITYEEGNVYFEGVENVPRTLTAVGALRDKRANCQGYSDAFYLLGTIAGFEVSRMYIDTPEGLHVTNVIYLDNQWYILDVTHDDHDDEQMRSYHLFNAGCDVINNYWWEEQWEYRPIAKTSSDQYYYKRQNAIYKDMNSIAKDIVAKWNGKGTLTSNVMLLNDINGDNFNAILKAELSKMSVGVKYSYVYRYHQNGKHTFYTITISNQ